MEEDTKLMRSYLSTIRIAAHQGRGQVSSMEIMRWEQRHIACMTVDMAARLQGSKLFFRIRQFLLMAVNCAIRPNGARVLPPKQQEITLPTGTASQGYFGLYRDGAKAGDVCSISGCRAGENKARISRDKIRNVREYDLQFRHDILSGQSGAPIYDDDYYVVGLFNYNAGFATQLEDIDKGENSGAKMTPAVFNFFKAIL